jgi:autotransporter-associated beta strand protein
VNRIINDSAGSASVTVNGGTVNLAAANTYDGGTNVTGGALRANGATVGSGAIAVGTNTLDIAASARLISLRIASWELDQ